MSRAVTRAAAPVAARAASPVAAKAPGCAPRLAHRPPAWMRRAEVAVLMRVFCRAFDVEAPSLCGLRPDDALRVFREFTAACMEAAQPSDELATWLRARLADSALALGRAARMCAPPPRGARLWLARYLYRGIGIEVREVERGHLRFCPCSFAQRYTPADCWFMSAFDEGFLRGILGAEDASLVFVCRITQGAPCCMARFDVLGQGKGSAR